MKTFKPNSFISSPFRHLMKIPRIRLGFSLRAKILTSLILVILGFSTSVFLANHFVLQKNTIQNVNKKMQEADSFFWHFLNARSQELLSQARLVTELPILRTVLVAADYPTILDTAKSYLQTMKVDFIWLTDENGRLLVRTDKPGERGTLLSEPAILKALKGEDSVEIALLDGQLFQFAAVPLLTAVPGAAEKKVWGVLLTGALLNDSLANYLKEATHTDITFFVEDRVVASSLPESHLRQFQEPATRKEIQTLYQQISSPQNPHTVTAFTISSGKEKYLSHASLLSSYIGPKNAWYLSQKSLKEELAPYQQVHGMLLIIGFLSLLLSGVVGLFVARGIANPISAVTQAAEILRKGSWPEPIPATKEDEVGTLAKTFNQMVTSLKSHQERMSALRTIDLAISGSLDLRLTLNVLLEQLMRQLGVHAVDILLFNPQTLTLEFAAGKGFRTRALQRTHLRLGEGYAGKAALERRTIHIPDLKRENSFTRSPLLPAEDFVTYFGFPLIARGEVKGVLEVFHRAPLDPTGEWREFLDTFAGQAAVAVDSATLFENLQRSHTELLLAYDATLEGWVKALDLRDRETEQHTQRVTEMTLRLARAMNVPEESLVHIRRGALLHDIGKIGVPDAILCKPGPLTEEEWAIMRKHPVFAYEMLSPIDFLRPALDIPYCHHEKWDGSGYPRGLKGEQIPLPARLFSIVDVWDALTSDRPYRKAWPLEKTLNYLQEQAGKHFDPRVLEKFLTLLKDV